MPAARLIRRTFNGLVAGSAAAAAAASLLGGSRSLRALETADLAWTSDDPHLSGNFMPIGPELDVQDLEVVSGAIPPELSGAYMRNGPNPQFKPLYFSYPMDGDGMIHRVAFDNGRASYRNRFVLTDGLKAERRVGHAIYGSFTHPVKIDTTLLQPGDPPGPFKDGAFINIIQHGGTLIALNEASPAYELTADLDTVGEWTAGTGKALDLGAHNRMHPKTGELYTLAYEVMQPKVDFNVISPDGKIARSFSIDLAAPTMIHDFVLTESQIVLFTCPAVFDLAAAKAGKSFLQWKPELGTRIALIALDGGAVRWLETDPFFVFHFANAFERGGQVVVDYVQHESLLLGYSAGPHKAPTLHRMTIELASGKIADAEISSLTTEFPRVNDALVALPTRYVYLPTLTSSLQQPNPPSATYNTMMKIDTETGTVVQHDLGNKIAGEACFIPRGTGGEDDGWITFFAYDVASETSDLVLLDAKAVDGAPVALIRMPQRVPQGLHGNWIAKG